MVSFLRLRGVTLFTSTPEEDAMVQTLQELVWIINEAKSELAHRQSSSWMQYWTAKEVYHSHKRRGQSCKTVTDQILSRALGLMAIGQYGRCSPNYGA